MWLREEEATAKHAEEKEFTGWYSDKAGECLVQWWWVLFMLLTASCTGCLVYGQASHQKAEMTAKCPADSDYSDRESLPLRLILNPIWFSSCFISLVPIPKSTSSPWPGRSDDFRGLSSHVVTDLGSRVDLVKGFLVVNMITSGIN